MLTGNGFGTCRDDVAMFTLQVQGEHRQKAQPPRGERPGTLWRAPGGGQRIGGRRAWNSTRRRAVLTRRGAQPSAGREVARPRRHRRCRLPDPSAWATVFARVACLVRIPLPPRNHALAIIGPLICVTTPPYDMCEMVVGATGLSRTGTVTRRGRCQPSHTSRNGPVSWGQGVEIAGPTWDTQLWSPVGPSIRPAPWPPVRCASKFTTSRPCQPRLPAQVYRWCPGS
jgi:hypothetical protein